MNSLLSRAHHLCSRRWNLDGKRNEKGTRNSMNGRAMSPRREMFPSLRRSSSPFLYHLSRVVHEREFNAHFFFGLYQFHRNIITEFLVNISNSQKSEKHTDERHKRTCHYLAQNIRLRRVSSALNIQHTRLQGVCGSNDLSVCTE